MSTATVNNNISLNQTTADNNIDRRYIRKQWKKLAKQKARLVFLLKCRRSRITPRFIMDRVTHLLKKYFGGPRCVKQKAKLEGDRIKSSLLNIEITSCLKEIETINARIDVLEANSFDRLPIHLATQTMNENENFYTTTLKHYNETHYKKYNELCNKQGDEKVKFDEAFIKNLSGIPIPREVTHILSLGPKFAIKPEVPPIVDLATDVEFTIQTKVPEAKRREARGETMFTISKFARQRQQLSRIDRYLQRAARITRKFLKDNPSIMVSNSDKGGVTIISKKEEYLNKIRAMLLDVESFSLLPKDPTTTIKNQVNTCLDNLYHANTITDSLKKRLKTWNTIPPRLFGQIKYHKPGHPIRLIVSTINSATYKMARFLATILRKAFKSKYSVKNSRAFIKMIRNKTISKDNVLVSFDVTNCFGNIPVELALEIIDRDFEVVAEHTPIGKTDFMEMLRICLQHGNYFVFEDKFYKQKLGMFMGSSLAPILVERVIEDIVDRSLCELKLIPDFWATYVDDHLTAIPREMIQVLADKLNSFHPKVQFTVEIQDDETKSINFLDTTVFNQQPKLITKWYYKKIASNRLLNFHSSHPKNMVVNVAKSFIRRVLTLTHKSFQKECIETAKNILERNSFPRKLIDELIHSVRSMVNPRRLETEPSYAFIDQSTQNQSCLNLSTTNATPIANSSMVSPTPTKEKKIYVGMTYIPKVTEMVSKQLKKHIPNLCAAPRPPNKVTSLFTDMKQKLRVGQNSMVVYDIPCLGCHKQKGYLGETTWNLDDRCGSRGHARDLKNIEKSPRATALVHHVATTQHQFDFNDKRILKKVRHQGILKINETNQIVLHEGYAVNFKRDAEHVTPMFYNILRHSERMKMSKIKSKCKPRITAVPTPKYKY